MLINYGLNNAVRKRLRKTVHDFYSMDSFACGFETRASPSDSLATGGSFRLME